MEVIDKENQNVHTKLNKRKSYSILGPVNQRTVDCNTGKNDRIISESTGLVKFSLSPNKKESEEKEKPSTPTKSRGKAGLSVYVPVNETIMEQTELSQDELMIQYASKQRQLIELEKQMETTKFEMAEISSKITKDMDKPMTEMNNLTNLRKKASNVFQINQNSSPNRDNSPMRSYVTKKASSIFQPSLSPAKSINSFGNYINKFQDQISQTQLTNPVLKNFVKDVKNKIDINENDKFKKFLTTQQSEFDEFTNKTSKFVNGIFCNISTNNRRTTNDEDMANSSFNFEAVGDSVDDTEALVTNLSFSDDESNDGNPSFDEDYIVDIDDYNSSFEE